MGNETLYLQMIESHKRPANVLAISRPKAAKLSKSMAAQPEGFLKKVISRFF
jgi:hypothetical protein